MTNDAEDLQGVRCCASCTFYDGERKRYKIGLCMKPSERRGGVPEKTWATALCYKYSALSAASRP